MSAGFLLKDNCKYELCPVCLFPDFPVDLQLRGVCLESQVDKFYVLHNSTELHGHGGSVLSWEDGENSWRQSSPLSLVELQRDLALIGPEVHDIAGAINNQLFMP